MKLEDFQKFALLFLVAGVVLGVGADVLEDISDKVVAYTANTAYDTDILFNASGYTVSTTADSGGGYSLTSVRNSSDNELVASGNYTFSAGVLTATAGASYNNSAVNVTYTYDSYDSVAYDAVENTTAGIGEMASWMPTIALVLAAALVIGIVTTYFVYRRKENY